MSMKAQLVFLSVCIYFIFRLLKNTNMGNQTKCNNSKILTKILISNFIPILVRCINFGAQCHYFSFKSRPKFFWRCLRHCGKLWLCPFRSKIVNTGSKLYDILEYSNHILSENLIFPCKCHIIFLRHQFFKKSSFLSCHMTNILHVLK